MSTALPAQNVLQHRQADRSTWAEATRAVSRGPQTGLHQAGYLTEGPQRLRPPAQQRTGSPHPAPRMLCRCGTARLISQGRSRQVWAPQDAQNHLRATSLWLLLRLLCGCTQGPAASNAGIPGRPKPPVWHALRPCAAAADCLYSRSGGSESRQPDTLAVASSSGRVAETA